MHPVATVLTQGRGQVVRLPAAFRFSTTEMFFRRDPDTGDVILLSKPNDWAGFFGVPHWAKAPSDFPDLLREGKTIASPA